MAEQPPSKKKQKPGGSFCAVGDCSNRGSRDKVSDHSGRGFLRYITLPTDKALKQKWVLRMNRDPRSWQPSLSTRVCTEHFFLSDFQEADLERYHARTNPETRTLVRLKVDSVPNTDRRTGSFANPLVQTTSKRPPPKERLVEMQTAGSNDGIDIKQDITNVSCSTIEAKSFWEINELDFSETDNEDNQPTDRSDDDFVTGLHNHDNEDINSLFSGELELDDLTDDNEPVIDESVESFKTKACWAIISMSSLLSLFKLCPEYGARSVIKGINCAGFGIVVHY